MYSRVSCTFLLKKKEKKRKKREKKRKGKKERKKEKSGLGAGGELFYDDE